MLVVVHILYIWRLTCFWPRWPDQRGCRGLVLVETGMPASSAAVRMCGYTVKSHCVLAHSDPYAGSVAHGEQRRAPAPVPPLLNHSALVTRAHVRSQTQSLLDPSARPRARCLEGNTPQEAASPSRPSVHTPLPLFDAVTGAAPARPPASTRHQSDGRRFCRPQQRRLLPPPPSPPTLGH